MVPIDQYACNAISNAGRLNQISAPVNGETSTTCSQKVPVVKSATLPQSLESKPVVGAATSMHLTCLEVNGTAGPSFMLNCTVAAS